MGLRLTTTEQVTAMFDSTTGWAFGPTFDYEEEAEEFLAWTEREGFADLRTYDNSDLADIHSTWIKERQEAGENI